MTSELPTAPGDLVAPHSRGALPGHWPAHQLRGLVLKPKPPRACEPDRAAPDAPPCSRVGRGPQLGGFWCSWCTAASVFCLCPFASVLRLSAWPSPLLRTGFAPGPSSQAVRRLLASCSVSSIWERACGECEVSVLHCLLRSGLQALD